MRITICTNSVPQTKSKSYSSTHGSDEARTTHSISCIGARQSNSSHTQILSGFEPVTILHITFACLARPRGINDDIIEAVFVHRRFWTLSNTRITVSIYRFRVPRTETSERTSLRQHSSKIFLRFFWDPKLLYKTAGRWEQVLYTETSSCEQRLRVLLFARYALTTLKRHFVACCWVRRERDATSGSVVLVISTFRFEVSVCELINNNY